MSEKKYNLGQILKEENNIHFYDLTPTQFALLKGQVKNHVTLINFHFEVERKPYLDRNYSYRFYINDTKDKCLLGEAHKMTITDVLENTRSNIKYIKFDDVDFNFYIEDTLIPQKFALKRDQSNYTYINHFINSVYAENGIKKKLKSNSSYRAQKLFESEYIHFSGKLTAKDKVVRPFVENGYTLIDTKTFIKFRYKLYKRYIDIVKCFTKEYYDNIISKYLSGEDISVQEYQSNSIKIYNINNLPKNFRVKSLNLNKYIYRVHNNDSFERDLYGFFKFVKVN